MRSVFGSYGLLPIVQDRKAIEHANSVADIRRRVC